MIRLDMFESAIEKRQLVLRISESSLMFAVVMSISLLVDFADSLGLMAW